MKVVFCFILSVLNLFSHDFVENKSKCRYSFQGVWISDQRKTLEWLEKLKGSPIQPKRKKGMKRLFGNLKHFVLFDNIISIYKGKIEGSKLKIVAEDANSIAFLTDSVFEKGEHEITLITFNSPDEFFIDTEVGIREIFTRVR